MLNQFKKLRFILISSYLTFKKKEKKKNLEFFFRRNITNLSCIIYSECQFLRITNFAPLFLKNRIKLVFPKKNARKNMIFLNFNFAMLFFSEIVFKSPFSDAQFLNFISRYIPSNFNHILFLVSLFLKLKLNYFFKSISGYKISVGVQIKLGLTAPSRIYILINIKQWYFISLKKIVCKLLWSALRDCMMVMLGITVTSYRVWYNWMFYFASLGIAGLPVWYNRQQPR